MNFIYSRRIRFADTDAAGVVYFANYLSICHEAYEESLLQAGVELQGFFREAGIVIPIAHSSADYLRPLACGDLVEVEVEAELIQESGFSVAYKLSKIGPPPKLAARIRTNHVCIDSQTRRRTALPALITGWISS
jgi:1,4-dihydroxy-2-naphthoyl-CoA hydrolase